jgi:allantoinase
MIDLIIKNSRIVLDDTTFHGNIEIKDGKVLRLSEKIDLKQPSKALIDADGMLVFPGAIDPHVHFNDPGLTESEDFFTGTCAAAAGGITTVLEHPLTDPLPSTYETLFDKYQIVKEKAVVDYSLWGACTPDNMVELDKMLEFGAIAFKAFIPHSPEIPSLNDGQLLDVMTHLSHKSGFLGVHCENDAITKHLSKRLYSKGANDPKAYSYARPEIAEIESVLKVALFSLETNCKTHIVHCSSPTAINFVREFKNRGADLSVESCMQYLVLTQSTLAELGPFCVCNPPVRNEATVSEMWESIMDDKIDFLGSDHAPYTFDEKQPGYKNIFDTPAGVTGVQTWVSDFFSEAVGKRKMSLNRFAELTSTNTAKRFGLYPRKGVIAEGSDADLTIFDPDEEWTIDPDTLFYKMKWTPFAGRKVKGRVKKTIVRGNVVYENGQINASPGWGNILKPS